MHLLATMLLEHHNLFSLCHWTFGLLKPQDHSVVGKENVGWGQGVGFLAYRTLTLRVKKGRCARVIKHLLVPLLFNHF